MHGSFWNRPPVGVDFADKFRSKALNEQLTEAKQTSEGMVSQDEHARLLKDYGDLQLRHEELERRYHEVQLRGRMK